MKKAVLAIVCMIAFATVKAQNVKVGVKAGLNVSSFNHQKYILPDDGFGVEHALDPRVGFHMGLSLEAKLGKSFSLQPEVIYSQLGAGSNKFDVSLDYLSLPVLAKFYIVKGFSFSAGPQFSFLLNKTTKFMNVDFNPEIENFDVGAHLGLGYKFDNGVFFNVNHVIGATEIIKQRMQNRNNVFQVSLGYQF
ncbi:porin family protein [Tenacibaculum xiamenense]|uniref:porin family protein n=1 Tax=Tenacibaculum xiamenense TaxID=1261553 RepID=UPI003892EA93